MRPRNNAEPGTGTQYSTVADETGEIFRANDTTWKVGHDYIDTEIMDVVELVAVVRKSSWCDTRQVEKCPAYLVFEPERMDGTLRVDPNDPSGDVVERFQERYEAPLPRGAERPW